MDMWMNADGVTLSLTMPEPDGRPLARDTIEGFYYKVKFGSYDGEIVRMSFQPAPDPEDPDAPMPPRKFVRLVLEELPPPTEADARTRAVVQAHAEAFRISYGSGLHSPGGPGL